MTLPPEIFKAYDIRGIVGKTLTPPIVRAIGQALGTLAQERGRDTLVVGRDGRLSGPELAAALADGIRASGANVVDVGMVATPMTYFAAHHLGTQSSVMVTGSHNPPDYNGLKMVVAGDTLSGDEIQALRARIEAGRVATRRRDLAQRRHRGGVPRPHRRRRQARAPDEDRRRLRQRRRRRLRPDALPASRLRSDRDVLRRRREFSEPPSGSVEAGEPRRPDRGARARASTSSASPSTATATGWAWSRATATSSIPDRQLMLFAADVLSRVPGATVIYDVKSTRNLKPWILRHGGVPLLWKTGHSLIKGKMKEVGAALAGEMSGHTFFKERWYGFDDGLYAGARLLEILSRHADPSAVLDALPDAVSTPELNVACAEGEHHALVAKLGESAEFPGATDVVRIDGLRVEYPDGFGLARGSNTTPVIVLRFEADNAAALERIKAEFRRVLAAAKPGIALPF